GTAAYMSPEQAKGRAVDRRTDIFAFGCVLYEMLTGRPTFEGEDVTEILSRVLQREPDWTAIPSNVPLRIRELLRLCLEKNAKNRRQSSGDLRVDLQRALAEPIAPTPLAIATRTRQVVWILATAAITATVVVATLRLRERPTPSLSEMRVEINT